MTLTANHFPVKGVHVFMTLLKDVSVILIVNNMATVAPINVIFVIAPYAKLPLLLVFQIPVRGIVMDKPLAGAGVM